MRKLMMCAAASLAVSCGANDNGAFSNNGSTNNPAPNNGGMTIVDSGELPELGTNNGTSQNNGGGLDMGPNQPDMEGVQDFGSATRFCISGPDGVCASSEFDRAAGAALLMGGQAGPALDCQQNTWWDFRNSGLGYDVRYVSATGSSEQIEDATGVWNALSDHDSGLRVLSFAPTEFDLEDPITVTGDATLVLVSPCWSGVSLDMRRPIRVTGGAHLVIAGMRIVGDTSAIEVEGEGSTVSILGSEIVAQGGAAVAASEGAVVSVYASRLIGRGAGLSGVDSRAHVNASVVEVRDGTAFSFGGDGTTGLAANAPFASVLTVANSIVEGTRPLADTSGVDLERTAAKFKNVEIRGMNRVTTGGTGIRVDQSFLSVQNGTIEENGHVGLSALGSRVIVQDSEFQENGWGAYVRGSELADLDPVPAARTAPNAFAPPFMDGEPSFLPGDMFLNSTRLLGDEFLPGDMFYPGEQFGISDQFLPGDMFIPAVSTAVATELAALDDEFETAEFHRVGFRNNAGTGAMVENVAFVATNSTAEGNGGFFFPNAAVGDRRVAGVALLDASYAFADNLTANNNRGPGAFVRLGASAGTTEFWNSSFFENALGGLFADGIQGQTVTVRSSTFIGNVAAGLVAADIELDMEDSAMLLNVVDPMSNDSYGDGVMAVRATSVRSVDSLYYKNEGYGLYMANVDTVVLDSNRWIDNGPTGANGPWMVGNYTDGPVMQVVDTTNDEASGKFSDVQNPEFIDPDQETVDPSTPPG